MKKSIFLILAIICLLDVGCAFYTVHPITGQNLDQKWRDGELPKGYVFYQPELYFLVTPNPAQKDGTKTPPSNKKSPKLSNPTPDKNSGFSVTPVYLPNPQKPYRLTTFNFLAKSDFTFNFKDGWQLSSIADKADNTTIANTLSGELATILSVAKFVPTAGQEKKAFLLHPQYDPQTGIITKFDVVYFPSISP
jgi:hypothetical protein